ncbi:Nose resistant to fluoxetine protein 6 [Eumeta japonica]|uniref:Nose resistant to fluoxetine protein 6 n=1 Tax=Eumeta variegata TaxID=151549 RepID=A0A4C1TIH0_EUMVA|nr:Nose resistant to fluoxetine protein 6 [Eumeta japonica]
MPPLYALEPYNECLSEPGGVYCVVDAGLFADPDNRLMNVIKKKNESRIKVVRVRSLRGVCEVSRKDRCRNSDVRERCGLKKDVVTGIERGMLRWFGHLERTNETRLTKQVYRANVLMERSARVALKNPVQTILVLYSNPSQLFFLNGSVLVQTFFVMSAFLLAFNFQLHAERHTPTWMDIPKGILIRWIRVTPTYLLVLGTVCTWFRHMGSGPLWYSLVESETRACRRYWWLHPLYLNNYVYEETFCMLQSWYLAADTQLFYIGLAICVLARSKRARRTVLWILFTVAIIGPAAEAYMLNMDASFMQTPESMRLVYAKSDVFRLTHIPAHMNLAPYVLGLAAGFLTYSLQLKQPDLSEYKVFTSECTYLLCEISRKSLN